jgi:hypothetical protein
MHVALSLEAPLEIWYPNVYISYTFYTFLPPNGVAKNMLLLPIAFSLSSLLGIT